MSLVTFKDYITDPEEDDPTVTVEVETLEIYLDEVEFDFVLLDENGNPSGELTDRATDSDVDRYFERALEMLRDEDAQDRDAYRAEALRFA